jgi:hypothetical protein
MTTGLPVQQDMAAREIFFACSHTKIQGTLFDPTDLSFWECISRVSMTLVCGISKTDAMETLLYIFLLLLMWIIMA